MSFSRVLSSPSPRPNGAWLMSHSPSTYKIPTSYDWPNEFNVNLVHWSRNKEQTIYRSKAVGEPPLMLSMSVFHAIRDAIAATAGDQQVQLDAPATPERILFALESVGKKSAPSASARRTH
jgi:xanthine dehydrogenase large subunit